MPGNIDPYLSMEITTKVVTSFFDKHLKQKDIDLNDLGAKYDMLELNVFKGDSLK